MILEIIVSICVIGGGVYGGYKANEKLKKNKKKLQDDIQREFDEGKILLPIDKRDFENLNEFKENTSHIKSVQEKLDSIDEDFSNLDFKCGGEEDVRK